MSADYWWIETREHGLTIGECRADSEGTQYVLVVGDGDHIYDLKDVRLIECIERPRGSHLVANGGLGLFHGAKP